MSTIRKLLVANRGEIARRVFRTCREMGIATVAVFSEADRDQPFAREADEAVALGGSAAAESYLDADKLLEAGRRAGADAIHPGYGFLAESAAFARRCAEASLVFVGPPAEAIAAMASKLEAKRRMQAAGVPLLEAAPVNSPPPFGFPAIVKAALGGGGRGMRVVHSAADLAGAVESARREAMAAFGDGALFLEPYLESARHVEVQVFADAHGHVVSLFERECSVQRRHQKLVEESPSPAVDPQLREALGVAAVAAARAVGYVGAGTVEFLLQSDGRFHFLEMNTRLQVEHPVTEMVTALDLVRLQILVAQGEPLSGDALSPRREGHAIEARLCAEDPSAGFLPAIGTIERFRVAAGVRVDAAIEDGAVVSPHYDSLLAKLVAHAPSRAEAAARLAAALASMRLHGVVTNRDLLVRVLRDPAFLAGHADTGWLERETSRLVAPITTPEADALHAVAAAVAGVAARRAQAGVLGFAPPAWRNNPSQSQSVAFETGGRTIAVEYDCPRGGFRARIDGEPLAIRLGARNASEVELESGGVRRRYEVHLSGPVAYVDSPLGHSTLREVERFAVPEEQPGSGRLVSPMPGLVVRLSARPGDHLRKGAVVAVLEAMKMEHAVVAPYAGRVSEVLVHEGQSVEAGVLLAVVEAEA
jgi:acetyl/propionyl-CoA carboxylase alpha subunit